MSEMTTRELDDWLVAHCGKGLPHGEVTDLPGALHALAYVHRQIAGTSKYMVNIGQCVSAETGLLWMLRYIAAQELAKLATQSPEPNP